MSKHFDTATEYFDVRTCFHPEDLGLNAGNDDYLVISDCLHKIQRLFADDWKYRDFNYRKFLLLQATANRVLTKYNKQIRH